MRLRIILCAAVLVLVAAACGGDLSVTFSETTDPEAPVESESPTTSSAADPSETPGTDGAPAAGPGDVPDLQMVDVHTGGAVNLQTLVTGQTPLLLWFWAPH